MGTLTEYLKDKAAKLRAEKPERERLIEDWRSALDRLLDQLEQWVREADTERILEVRRTEHKFNDEGMGPYTAPGLDITAGLPRVILEDAARTAKALDWMRGGMDFADALHLAEAEGCEAFTTFDQRFAAVANTLSDVKVRTP